MLFQKSLVIAYFQKSQQCLHLHRMSTFINFNAKFFLMIFPHAIPAQNQYPSQVGIDGIDRLVLIKGELKFHEHSFQQI